MINLKNNKGITIYSLVITVIVLVIIAGTATYTAMDVYQDAKKEAFIQELQMVQNAVNNEYSKIEAGNYECLEWGEHIVVGGENEDEAKTVISKAKNVAKDEIDWSLEEYKFTYFNKSMLQNIEELKDIKQEILINFLTHDVISFKGLRISGEEYYSLEQMNVQNNYYNNNQLDNNLYIQANLISWWDAIENGNTTVWKDLSGNNDLTFKGAYTKEDKYINLGTNSDARHSIIEKTILPVEGDFTIELRAKVNLNASKGSTGILSHGNSPHEKRFNLWYNKSTSATYLSYRFVNNEGTTVNRNVYVTETDENFYNNIFNAYIIREYQSIKLKLIKADLNINTQEEFNENVKAGNDTLPEGKNIEIARDYFSIGSAGASAHGHEGMKVYSCRIYNKAFTDEEILYNYNIDNSRFN